RLPRDQRGVDAGPPDRARGRDVHGDGGRGDEPRRRRRVRVSGSTSQVRMSVSAGGGAPLLEVRNLSVRFRTPDGIVHAVSDLSYTLRRGETLGVVGESGSGKSVSSLALMGLLNRSYAQIEGEI